MDDLNFFQNCMNEAQEQCKLLLKDEKNCSIDVEPIKKQLSPVLYCSKLTTQTRLDNVISRKELNQRLKRRYLIIDVDYNSGEEKESEVLKEKLINLSNELNCYLLIYPTLSYPDKPRFRAIMLTEKLLDESVYYSAISWLYDKLQMQPTDMNDYNIKSNNNLPIFINQEQLDFVYNNLHEERNFLSSDLWKKYPRKKKIKVENYSDSEFLDQLPIDKEKLISEIKKWSKTEYSKEYMNFWLLTSSITRAYIFGQLSDNDVKKCMKEISKATDDNLLQLTWEQNNMVEFEKCLSRLKDKSNLEKTRPLIQFFNGSIL